MIEDAVINEILGNRRTGVVRDPNNPGLKDLCEYASTKKDIKRVAEVGSYNGASMWAVCTALRPWLFISVDPYSVELDKDGILSYDNVDKVKNEFDTLAEAAYQRYGTVVVKIKGTIEKLDEFLHVSNVHPDMVYIDGAHDYTSVFKDLSYCNKFKKSFVLAGHDAYHEGVKNALEAHGIDTKTFSDSSWITEKYL